MTDFVDFLSYKDQEKKLVEASGKLAEDSFKKVWDNPEDDIYDTI